MDPPLSDVTFFGPKEVGFHGFLRYFPWFFMVFGWFTWFSTLFHGFFMVSGWFPWFFKVVSWFLVGFNSFSRWFHDFWLVSMVLLVENTPQNCILAQRSSLGLAGRRPALA